MQEELTKEAMLKKELEKDGIRKRMFLRAYHITKNEEDSKDIVQEAIIKVLTHMHAIHDEQHLMKWMAFIVKNMAIDYVRKRQKYSKVIVTEEMLENIPKKKKQNPT